MPHGAHHGAARQRADRGALSARRGPGRAAARNSRRQLEIGKGRIVREGKKVAILSLGTRLEEAEKAADELDAKGLSTTVADLRFAKPLDSELIRKLLTTHEVAVTVEEAAIGGLGAHVLTLASDEGLLDAGLKIRTMRLPDRFQEHDKPEKQYDEARLNAPHIVETVLKALRRQQRRRRRGAGVAKVRADQLLGEPRARREPDAGSGADHGRRGVFAARGSSSKAGEMLADDAALEVRGKDHPWVSRGRDQARPWADAFRVRRGGRGGARRWELDGGFTDVLLSRGAAKVYAVDVGTNQLAWKLRQDPRVVVHEQTNARSLDSSIIPEPVDIIVCDASFIGLAKVLEAPLKLAKAGAQAGRADQAAVRGGARRGGQGRGGSGSGGARARLRGGKAWVEAQGWTVLGIDAEPDHRARRQCRVPAGRRENWG